MFSKRDLMQLVDHQAVPCVSVYLPVHATGREQQQDEIRLKNLAKQAAHQLTDHGVDRRLRDELLHPINAVPRDDELWQHRSDGLALFSAPDFFRCFSLPLPFAELVSVGEEFCITPLLPILHANARYFILALTKDSADLYEATRYSLFQHDLPELSPIAVDGGERALQQHSHRTPSQGRGSTDEAMFHGQGAADDREKTDIMNFFRRQVEPEVTATLNGEVAPLVLACVDYLAAMYREVNTYEHLIEGHVAGSPENMSNQQLRQQAWNLVEPLVRESEAKARQRFGDLSSSGRAVTELEQVQRAAREGRVETLFVPAPHRGDRRESQERGPDIASIEPMEEAAQQTLIGGGRVMAVEDVPQGGPLAAVLRY